MADCGLSDFPALRLSVFAPQRFLPRSLGLTTKVAMKVATEGEKGTSGTGSVLAPLIENSEKRNNSVPHRALFEHLFYLELMPLGI